MEPPQPVTRDSPVTAFVFCADRQGVEQQVHLIVINVIENGRVGIKLWSDTFFSHRN